MRARSSGTVAVRLAGSALQNKLSDPVVADAALRRDRRSALKPGMMNADAEALPQ